MSGYRTWCSPPRRRWSWRYSSTGSAAGRSTDWCLLEVLVKKASHKPTSFSRKSDTRIRVRKSHLGNGFSSLVYLCGMMS